MPSVNVAINLTQKTSGQMFLNKKSTSNDLGMEMGGVSRSMEKQASSSSLKRNKNSRLQGAHSRDTLRPLQIPAALISSKGYDLRN